MRKILLSMIALVFAVGIGAGTVVAGEKKDDPVAKACKGKKAGTVVKVDGKDVKCPDNKAKK